MWGYLAQRLTLVVLLWLGLSAFAFALLKSWPGVSCLDPDRWWLQQYVDWLGGLSRLNFDLCNGGGSSFDMLFSNVNPGDRLVQTLLLSGGTLLLTGLIVLPLGVYAATHPYSLGDTLFRAGSFVGLGLPPFVLALLLVAMGAPLQELWPAVFVIAFGQIAVVARYLRSHLLDVLGQVYLQAARCKGLSEGVIIWKHALRNALQPLLSLMGIWLQATFEGALVVAAVLGVRTVEGAFLQGGIQSRDPGVIVAGLLFFGALLLVSNLIVDLVRLWADPRIRYAD